MEKPVVTEGNQMERAINWKFFGRKRNTFVLPVLSRFSWNDQNVMFRLLQTECLFKERGHPEPSLFLFALESTLWCFSYLANHYRDLALLTNRVNTRDKLCLFGYVECLLRF